MPLPVILGVAAAAAAIGGVASGLHGAAKMKDANDTMKEAQARQNGNLRRFEEQNKATSATMDTLGQLELEILDSFQRFSDAFEQIQNKPEFKVYEKEGVTLPKYNPEELKKVSVGAGVLLGGLGGAALGTAGGFAAAGATTAAVMALGTASTGTAIASLSGAALTNATLAALGGGALAVGGGGIALGTTILGAATLGVGLLVGGIIFNFTGASLSDKADEAWAQMKRAEGEIDKICAYLSSLKDFADQYTESLSCTNKVYQKHLSGLTTVVDMLGKKDWNLFTEEERLLTENTVLLVGLMYNMCNVKIVLKSEKKGALNALNTREANQSMENARQILADRALS